METSKTITTVFMVVALLAMAALALSVNRKPQEAEQEYAELAANIAHLERLLSISGENIYSVEVAGCAPGSVRQTRPAPGSPLAGDDLSALPQPCSDLLVRSNALLGKIKTPGGFVNDESESLPAGSITYVRFDGLVLEIAPTGQGSLRLRADYDAETAAKFRNVRTGQESVLPVAAIAAQLNSGRYDGISGPAD